MNKSVALFEKNVPHLSIPDWFADYKNLREMSRQRRSDCFNLRQNACELRNETNVLTEWDTYLNNDRLKDRIFEVDRWRDAQQFYFDNVQQEIQNLKREKENLEHCLESLTTPLMVVAECLSNRDRRRISELTHDPLDDALKKELSIIENNRRLLREASTISVDRLITLDVIRNRLEKEIRNKEETLKIDRDQFFLNKESANISYKPDPLNFPVQSSTEESWMESIRLTLNIAEKEMAESKMLREYMFSARERAKNEIYTQNNAVDFVLRQRVYQIQSGRNEMDWQKMKLESSLQLLDQETSTLQSALLAKTNVGKLAETRLENRTYRPTMELINDKVEYGLRDEVMNVRSTEQHLRNKLDRTKEKYNDMSHLLNTIKKDLGNKNHALETDRQCIEIRKPLARANDSYLDRRMGNLTLASELPKI